MAKQKQSLVLGFPDYIDPAKRLAEAANLAFAELDIHGFPDGESLVRLPEQLPERVIFCRSLDHPNAKLVELLLAAETARSMGVTELTLVTPYLCYMRQDIAFRPGEAVSQRIIGSLLARCFDRVITVDPHLHRVHELKQAVPARQSIALSAAPAMGRFLEQRLPAPLLLGPDEESLQWVSQVAAGQGFEFLVGSKRRLGDREVEIDLPTAEYAQRHIVLVDDVASTGYTLEVAARQLSLRHPASISVLVTHALFEDDAIHRLHSAGVGQIWSTDSIVHPSNSIYLAEMLAKELEIRN